jgi:dATP/dGTP diphosphohydrolase
MSHYDKFRSAPCLVPVGNASDLFKEPETNTIDDALGFCNKPVEKEKEVVSVKKHIKGKAEGARFCYLAAIAAASEYAETAVDYLARRLDNLLDRYPEVSEQINLMMIVEYASIVMGSKDLWKGVIAVRRKALESGKYTQESWKEPIDPDLLLDAAARHMISYLYVDEIDEESGENHLCHIVANVLMLAYQLSITRHEG